MVMKTRRDLLKLLFALPATGLLAKAIPALTTPPPPDAIVLERWAIPDWLLVSPNDDRSQRKMGQIINDFQYRALTFLQKDLKRFGGEWRFVVSDERGFNSHITYLVLKAERVRS